MPAWVGWDEATVIRRPMEKSVGQFEHGTGRSTIYVVRQLACVQRKACWIVGAASSCWCRCEGWKNWGGGGGHIWFWMPMPLDWCAFPARTCLCHDGKLIPILFWDPFSCQTGTHHCRGTGIVKSHMQRAYTIRWEHGQSVAADLPLDQIVVVSAVIRLRMGFIDSFKFM